MFSDNFLPPGFSDPEEISFSFVFGIDQEFPFPREKMDYTFVSRENPKLEVVFSLPDLPTESYFAVQIRTQLGKGKVEGKERNRFSMKMSEKEYKQLDGYSKFLSPLFDYTPDEEYFRYLRLIPEDQPMLPVLIYRNEKRMRDLFYSEVDEKNKEIIEKMRGDPHYHLIKLDEKLWGKIPNHLPFSRGEDILYNFRGLKKRKWKNIQELMKEGKVKRGGPKEIVSRHRVVAGGAIFTRLYNINHECDIDVFFHGIKTDEEGVEEIMTLSKILNHVGSVRRTKNSVALISGGQEYGIALRLYQTPSEIIHGFDVDCCCMLYDGKDIWITERCYYSLLTGTNVFNPDLMSPSYERRLAKYANRGIGIYIPKFQRSSCVEPPDDDSYFIHSNFSDLPMMNFCYRKEIEEFLLKVDCGREDIEPVFNEENVKGLVEKLLSAVSSSYSFTTLNIVASTENLRKISEIYKDPFPAPDKRTKRHQKRKNSPASSSITDQQNLFVISNCEKISHPFSLLSDEKLRWRSRDDVGDAAFGIRSLMGLVKNNKENLYKLMKYARGLDYLLISELLVLDPRSYRQTAKNFDKHSDYRPVCPKTSRYVGIFLEELDEGFEEVSDLDFLIHYRNFKGKDGKYKPKVLFCEVNGVENIGDIFSIDPVIYDNKHLDWDMEANLKFKVHRANEQMTSTFQRVVLKDVKEWYRGFMTSMGRGKEEERPKLDEIREKGEDFGFEELEIRD